MQMIKISCNELYQFMAKPNSSKENEYRFSNPGLRTFRKYSKHGTDNLESLNI